MLVGEAVDVGVAVALELVPVRVGEGDRVEVAGVALAVPVGVALAMPVGVAVDVPVLVSKGRLLARISLPSRPSNTL